MVDIDYGRWQGLTPDEARARWPLELDTWYHDPQAVAILGGEMLDWVRIRAMEAVTGLAAHYPDQSVVLVSHAVVNRVILLGVLGLRSSRFWRLRQDSCALNRFEADGNEFSLIAMNDTCHLRVRF